MVVTSTRKRLVSPLTNDYCICSALIGCPSSGPMLDSEFVLLLAVMLYHALVIT